MASSEKVNIPQKPPMVMVDRLISAREGITETTFTVGEDNIFLENGLFTEPGLVENMAQTAAAGVGSRPGHESEPAPLGFIGGIRDLIITTLPPAGAELRSRVTVEHEVFDATVASGEVFWKGNRIASCGLKIFLIR